MSDELRRIMRLVQEGKLSADDAMDLVDAIQGGSAGPPPIPPDAEAAAWDRAETTPPTEAPQAEAKSEGKDEDKDPLKAAMDAMEKVGRDIASAVNWKEVSEQIRTGAKRGFEAIRDAAKEIAEGKINFSFLGIVATRTQELPLAFDTGKTLRVDNAAGLIKVVGQAPLGKVLATAQVQAGSQEEAEQRADRFTLVIEESDSFVDIKLPDIQGLVTDLTIHLSQDANLELKTRSGDIIVEQVKGNLRITGASGDVRLVDASGVVEISTASGAVHVERAVSPSITIENKAGDIKVHEVEGALNARSASGDIFIEGYSGRVLAIEAVSGDVLVGMKAPFEGTMTLRTVSGNARLNLADGNSARVTLSTLSGHVNSDLELTDRTDQDKRVVGTLGGGAGTIDISAVAGDISVSQIKTAGVV